jgi:hypothetical protein
VSNEAITWALEQPVAKSSAKFVLVVMANLAGDNMTCWPSYRHLTDATAQDVKTVQAGLRRLREEGFISDTGERKGSTGQVIVYRLNTPAFGGVTPPAKTPEIPGNTPKNGALSPEPKTPVFPDKTPVFPGKDPQISHETPPKTGDGHHKDTSRTPKTPQKKSADRVDLLTDVPDGVIADYLTVRKARRAGALTETAVDGLRREAGKAGLSLPEAVRACCEFGWQGFNAGWYAQRVGTTTTARPANRPSKHAGFQSMNYLEGVNADGSLA